MASLKSFNKDWENLTDLGERVRILDNTKENPSAFPAYHSDFLGFVKDVYKLHKPQLNILNIGHPWQKTEQAEIFHYFTRKRTVKETQGNIADISNDLGDDLEDIAFSVIPVRDADLRDVDKLDVTKLIVNYKAKAAEKRNELSTINHDEDPERYDAIKDLADEYEAFSGIIGFHKPLIKEIAKYNDLRSHLFSRDGEPDTKRLKSLVDAYLDKLGKARNLNEHDKDAIRGTKLLASNPKNLGSYYNATILEPAKEKVKGIVTTNKYNIKDYLDNTVKGMNFNSAASFFTGLHAKMAA